MTSAYQQELILHFRAEFQDLQNKLGNLKSSIEGTKASVESSAVSFGGMAAAIGLGTIAANAAWSAFDAVKGAITGSVAAAQEAEDSQVKLAALLHATGSAAGISRDTLNQWASDLQAATGIGDEAIGRVQSIFLTFRGIQGETFREGTELALDMSKVFGQDLASSAVILGKALGDPVQGMTALRRIGVQLTDDQEALVRSLTNAGDAAGAQKVILDELRQEVGGVARAMGETSSGSLAKLREDFNNLQEVVGEALNDGLKPLVRELDTFAKSDDAKQMAVDLGQAMAGLAQATADATRAFYGLRDAGNALTFLGRPGGLSKSIADFVTEKGGGALRSIFDIEGTLGFADRSGPAISRAEGITDAEAGVTDRSQWPRLLPSGKFVLSGRNDISMDDFSQTLKGIFDKDLGPSAKGAADALRAHEEALRLAKQGEEALFETNRLLREAEQKAIQDGIEARRREAEAIQQFTIGYLQGLGQRGTRFAPGVFESIAKGGGLNTDFGWYSVDGGPQIPINAAVP